MRVKGRHKLIHPIVLETIKDGETEPTEEELKPAGFCVILRRGKAKDQRIIDQYQDKPIALTLAMLKRLTNLEEIEVENLDEDDLEELGNLAMDEPESGPKTGPTA